MNNAKRIVVLLGDPSGIGPEIIYKSLSNLELKKDIEYTVVADQRSLTAAKEVVKIDLAMDPLEDLQEIRGGRLAFYDYRPVDITQVTAGTLSTKGGLAVIKTMEMLLPLVGEGLLHGIIFGPFNKQGLHEAGFSFHSELEYLEDYFQVKNIPGEINIIGGVWAVRITSHVALRDVCGLLSTEKVLNGIRFLSARLKESGITQPKLGVAGLNPHNGEDGLFGDEESRIIAPAVRAAQQEGYDVAGPYPADTLFLRMKREGFHGIVGMYHDQLQIGLKLLGFDTGVTLLGGLPIPITTGAHGTALDIAGKGIAKDKAVWEAIQVVTKMVETKQQSE